MILSLAPAGAARPDQTTTVTEEEILKAIPATGTTIPELLIFFKGRVGNRNRFIQLVKANTKFLKQRLYLKGTPAASGAPVG